MSLSEDQSINEKLEADNDKLLLDVHTVYTFIKENERTKTLYTQTINDFLQQAIDEIQGPTKNNRPSKLKKLDQIQTAISDIEKALS